MIDSVQIRRIISLTDSFRPSLIGIFGSHARNEAVDTSDLDILIEFKDRVNLLDLVGLEQELSKGLGKKVDLVTKKSLNPILAPIILKELKIIHEG